MFSVFSWSFVPTLKYSTRPLQVILLPLISFMSMLRGLRSHGTRTFRLFKKSPSISGRGGEATAGERAQHVLKLSCIQFLVLVEEISGKYQQFRAANSQTRKQLVSPGRCFSKAPMHHLLLHNSLHSTQHQLYGYIFKGIHVSPLESQKSLEFVDMRL